MMFLAASDKSTASGHIQTSSFRQASMKSAIENDANASVVRRAQGSFPSALLSCNGAVPQTQRLLRSEYRTMVRAIQRGLDRLGNACGPTDCPKADVTGCVLRLAGHDFMDYDPRNGRGGADGCLDMSHPDNAGLESCLYTGEEFGFSLNSVYQQWCGTVSLADFLVIGAEAVMDYTRAVVRNEVPGSARMNFRGRFRYGRRTATSCEGSGDILPNPETCLDVERVFVNNLGLSWAQAAALMGVHTLGRANPRNSGYDGFWSDPENSRRFNNNFFVSMLANGWMPDRSVGGNGNKNQWKKSNVNFRPAEEGRQMMLDTDLCLAFSSGGLSFNGLRAADHTCCAWAIPMTMVEDGPDGIALYNDNEFCGNSNSGEVEMWKTFVAAARAEDRLPLQRAWEEETGQNAVEVFRDMRAQCCEGCEQHGDCGDANRDCGSTFPPTGLAIDHVRAFAQDEDHFISQFMNAWRAATTRGHSGLRRMERG